MHRPVPLVLIAATALTADSRALTPPPVLEARVATVARLAQVTAEGPGDEVVVDWLPAGMDPWRLRLHRLALFPVEFRLVVGGELRPSEDVLDRYLVLGGDVEQHPGSLVVLFLDRRLGLGSGIVRSGDQLWAVEVGAAEESRPLVAAWRARRVAVDPQVAVGSDMLLVAGTREPVKAARPRIIPAPGSEYAAALVIDSDFEFFQRMGSEERALAFVAQVIAAASELYSRQVGVSLTIQEVVLTPSPDDPWEAPDPHECRSLQVLREFGEWYQVHRPVARFPRAAAMLFTGKRADCGGQAVIAGLCTQVRRQDLGYGMVVVSSNEAASSQQGTGHELGHVFGSVHTHCYRPPIDLCSAAEADRGCYDGPTDVPGDGGSLMSYCSNRVFSLGEAGRYGDHSERVAQTIRSLVEEVAPSCLARTNDPYELRGEVAGRTVTLSWMDLFQGEKRWEVEQRQRSGKFRLVRALPPNASGVKLPGQKPGATAFRVRAQVGRDLAEYSAVVEVTVP